MIVGMKADLEMLKTSFGGAMKVGPVEEVDAEKGYRLNLGEGSNGTPFLSPWYPHPESGGQTGSWVPLSKGQIVGVINPTGDPRQGVMFRAGFSDVNPPPSQDMMQNMLKAFGITISMKDGTLRIEAGDVEIVVSGHLVVVGNADFRDGYIRSNGHAIDDTHKHKDTMPGSALSGVPQ